MALLLTVREGSRLAVRRIDQAVTLGDLSPRFQHNVHGSWVIAPGGAQELCVHDREGQLREVLTPGRVWSLAGLQLELESTPETTIEARSSSPPQRLVLVCEGKGRVVLQGPEFTIGKHPRCNLVLADPHVSSLHCIVQQSLNGWELRDLGSTNGTYLAGARTQAFRLHAGLAFTLGHTLIRVEAAEQGNAEALDAPGLELLGKSPVMRKLKRDILRFAALPCPVLITGETGSGKDVVARLLHQFSPHSKGPFVAVNTATLSPELVESELFGHERGSFTGAAGRRRGVFEEASGGTLFLDEMGELPLAQQAKLLRVLENREIRRVGAEGVITVDARVVCATHRDLEQLCARGLFREDLRFRLQPLQMEVPPLRERLEDLPQLCASLLHRVGLETGQKHSITPAALQSLRNYHWPGNVRELLGVLRRAAVRSDQPCIDVSELQLGRRTSSVPPSGPLPSTPQVPLTDARFPALPLPPGLPQVVDLQAVLRSYEGNISLAAKSLGLPRSTFRDRLAKYSRAAQSG